jgi:hypothetical protein
MVGPIFSKGNIMTKKKAAAPKYYAQANVGIDGKHFASASEIKDVDDDQLAIAIRMGKAATSKPKFHPAPEIEASEPEMEVNEAAEITGEGVSVDEAAGPGQGEVES